MDHDELRRQVMRRLRSGLNVIALERDLVRSDGPFGVALTNGLASIVASDHPGAEKDGKGTMYPESRRLSILEDAGQSPDFAALRDALSITQPPRHARADDEDLLPGQRHLPALVDLDGHPALLGQEVLAVSYPGLARPDHPSPPETAPDGTAVDVECEAWRTLLSGAESHVEDDLNESRGLHRRGAEQIVERAMQTIHDAGTDKGGQRLMTGTGGTAVYVEAPTIYTGDLPAVFLAGGITGCRDWQAQAHDQLADMPVAVLNPRRAHFPINDPTAAAGQIGWEFEHLRRADVVLFWFPASDTVQPIALYELGMHAAGGKLIAVGVDAGYPRRIDVMLQLGHVRPEVKVWGSLVATVAEARRLVAHVRR